MTQRNISKDIIKWRSILINNAKIIIFFFNRIS